MPVKYIKPLWLRRPAGKYDPAVIDTVISAWESDAIGLMGAQSVEFYFQLLL